MITANLTSNFENATARFHQASAQTQLAVLRYLVQKIHKASKTATPSALFSQKVHGVLQQVQQLPKEERLEALAEILKGAPTRLAEVYEGLDTNMRMAFWYRLVNRYQEAVLLPVLHATPLHPEQERLLMDLESRDSNELVAFLRDVLADGPAPL